MAAPENLTTASQITTSIREVDFVTQFQKNWDALRTILGIMRPIRKAPGTKLVSYKATVDGGLQGGTGLASALKRGHAVCGRSGCGSGGRCGPIASKCHKSYLQNYLIEP